MLGNRCDICNAPAKVHETVIEAGAARTRHRCGDHGETTWRDATVRVEPRLQTDPQSVLRELREIVEKDPQFWYR